jgi:hypothetical protein
MRAQGFDVAESSPLLALASRVERETRLPSIAVFDATDKHELRSSY